MSAQRAQFAHVVFIPTIDMMDIVDARFAFRRKTSDHERRTTTQVRRRDRCALQSWNTLNERMMAIKANIRAQTD